MNTGENATYLFTELEDLDFEERFQYELTRLGVVTKAGPFGPPGPPPRPGLAWKPETHRWIRPHEITTKTSSGVIDFSREDVQELDWDQQSRVVDSILAMVTKPGDLSPYNYVERLKEKSRPGYNIKIALGFTSDAFLELEEGAGFDLAKLGNYLLLVEDGGIQALATWSISISEGFVIDKAVVHPANFLTKGSTAGTKIMVLTLRKFLESGEDKITTHPLNDHVSKYYQKVGFEPGRFRALSMSREVAEVVHDKLARFFQLPAFEKAIDPELAEILQLEEQVGVLATSSANFSEGLSKAGPPGPPPRPGLEWKPETHRWIRPKIQGERPRARIKEDPLLGKPFVEDLERARLTKVNLFDTNEQLKFFGPEPNPEVAQHVTQNARFTINASSRSASRVLDSNGFIPARNIGAEMTGDQVLYEGIVGRPIYGSIQTHRVGIRNYGDVIFELKDSVIPRMTVSSRDSAFLHQSGIVDQVVAGKNWKEAAARRYSSFNLSPGMSLDLKIREVENYMEIQIFGGVDLDDIKKVIVPPINNVRNIDDLIQLKTRLTAKGIPFEEY